MGGVSTREAGQVCFVTFPSKAGSSCTALALIPFIKHYFPTPASVAALHALYCSDRVKESFCSSSIRRGVQEYYTAIVDAAENTRQKTTAMDPPKPVPLAVMILARDGTGAWSVLGYLSYRCYNVKGDTFDRGVVGIFKRYTGSQPAGETDIGIAAIRAAVAMFSHMAKQEAKSASVRGWPREMEFTFNHNNSGTAGIMNRLFKYIALRNPDLAFGWSCTYRDDAELPQYKIESSSAESLRVMGETLSTDKTLSCSDSPSLKAIDGGRLWDFIRAQAGYDETWPDEPCVVVNIAARTNDANFSTKDPRLGANNSLMALAQRLTEIHQECKMRSHRVISVACSADIGENLFKSFGLKKLSAAQQKRSLEKVSFLIIASLPDEQMHAPTRMLDALVRPIASALYQDPSFAPLLAGDDAYARLGLMEQCAADHPWMVVTTLCDSRGGNAESWKALRRSIAKVTPSQYDASPQSLLKRVQDMRVRGLTGLGFDDVQQILKAVFGVDIDSDEARKNYTTAETVDTVLKFVAVDDMLESDCSAVAANTAAR